MQIRSASIPHASHLEVRPSRSHVSQTWSVSLALVVTCRHRSVGRLPLNSSTGWVQGSCRASSASQLTVPLNSSKQSRVVFQLRRCSHRFPSHLFPARLLLRSRRQRPTCLPRRDAARLVCTPKLRRACCLTSEACRRARSWCPLSEPAPESAWALASPPRTLPCVTSPPRCTTASSRACTRQWLFEMAATWGRPSPCRLWRSSRRTH